MDCGQLGSVGICWHGETAQVSVFRINTLIGGQNHDFLMKDIERMRYNEEEWEKE